MKYLVGMLFGWAAWLFFIGAVKPVGFSLDWWFALSGSVALSLAIFALLTILEHYLVLMSRAFIVELRKSSKIKS